MSDDAPPLLCKETDYGDLLIEDGNETAPLIHDSTLIDTSNNQSNSSADQNSPNDSKSATRTSKRRRAPPKRMLEADEPPILNLAIPCSSGIKRFKLTPKQEPIDESEQSPVVVPANRLTPEEDDPNVKPRHSYCTLVILALLSSPNYTMTLSDVYRYISARFAYYRNSTGNWQNGIRHNLSMNKLFRKVPKIDGQFGKGGLWTFAKHVNPDVQFSQHLQQRNPVQQASQIPSPMKRSIHVNSVNESSGETKPVRSNHQSSSHPLRTLVLEQLQNAANGVYSNVNPLFGTTNGPSASTTLNKNLPEQAEKAKEQDPMLGLPTMSHEQLAMAQANWYVAQLATQRGFALVPEFYERCLKQIQAYYNQEPQFPSSTCSANKFGSTVKRELNFNNRTESLEVARGEDNEEE